MPYQPSRAHPGAPEMVVASTLPESATATKVFMEWLAIAVESTRVARRAIMERAYVMRLGLGKIASGRLWHARQQSWVFNVLAMVLVTH